VERGPFRRRVGAPVEKKKLRVKKGAKCQGKENRPGKNHHSGLGERAETYRRHRGDDSVVGGGCLEPQRVWGIGARDKGEDIGAARNAFAFNSRSKSFEQKGGKPDERNHQRLSPVNY